MHVVGLLVLAAHDPDRLLIGGADDLTFPLRVDRFQRCGQDGVEAVHVLTVRLVVGLVTAGDTQLLVEERNGASVLVPLAALAPVAAEMPRLGRVLHLDSVQEPRGQVGQLVGALPVGCAPPVRGEQLLVGLRQLDAPAADARQERGQGGARGSVLEEGV